MNLRFLLLSVGFLAAIYLGGFLLDNYVNAYVLRVLVNCGIAFILALSLNLVNGCAGQFSLGHAGFMAVGAYGSAYLTTIVSQYTFFQSTSGVGIAIVIGGILSGVAGYLVGLPSLRLKGDYLAIVTLGFGEIIRVVFINVEAIGGPRGLSGIPIQSNFFWVYLWVGITFLFLFRFIRSSSGRTVLAIREDEIAAEAMGVNTARQKVIAFVLSSFFAGIAGGLFAHYQGFIDPQSFGFNRSVEIVIMVVIGGMGSLSGAILGAIIVTILPEFLRVFEQYRMIVFPLILILSMLLRPRGLLGDKEIWNLHIFKREPKGT